MQTRINFIVLFLMIYICPRVLGQTKSYTSLEMGIASNLAGNAGYNFSLNSFSTKVLSFDYSAYFNKDGFYYHEISPKLGLGKNIGIMDVSLSTGIAFAFYPDRNTSGSHSDPYKPVNFDNPDIFVGIPIQPKVEFRLFPFLGMGLKWSYMLSLTEDFENRSTFAFYFSARLHSH